MDLDYSTLRALRDTHPAWRLLCAENAPMIASFLYKTFVKPNVRSMSEPDLIEALEDELFTLRQQIGNESFPKDGKYYLSQWVGADKGWLKKFYKQNSDEAYFDLTPATEKALLWLVSLGQRGFVGTESRLLTLFDLLKQMVEGSEINANVRIKELEKRRAEINAEIEQLNNGVIPLMDDTSIKDRFQQFVSVARELLTDFREVEENFRKLDRQVREKIALWDGSKGSLIDEIMGERDSIADTDQGRSFHAFWDFLMSSRRQEEFTHLLESVMSMPAIVSLQPDSRTRRVHYDWLEAGESTQRTVAQLSGQLRRFLDDVTLLENRRISEILRNIEGKAIALRDDAPKGDFTEVASATALIELPLERPMYKPSIKVKLKSALPKVQHDDVATDALFSQVVVDKAKLARNIRNALQERSQIALSELLRQYPMENGLAELIAYLQLGADLFNYTVDPETIDTATWWENETLQKQASFARIVFVR